MPSCRALQCGLRTISDVELGQDVGDVILDGAFGEAEAVRDLLVGRAGPEQRKDLALAR